MRRNQKINLLWALSVVAIVAVLLLPRQEQNMAYHLFADQRPLWGIPNAANVLSNLPFLVVGLAGFILVLGRKLHETVGAIYTVLFTGIFLTGLGSAYYHWHPDNNTLVWDRMPLCIVFMSLLAATIAELISRPWGFRLFIPLVLAGIASVWLWHMGELHGTGDLRFYGLVQFYPVVFLPIILLLFYDSCHRGAMKALAWVVVWYVLAKAIEVLDKSIFVSIGISGHTLKHLAAAVSTWWLVVMFHRKYPLAHERLSS